MGNSPLRASRESEQQTLVLRGIQVILLVRLVALVSNRPSALGPPSLEYTPFSWTLVRGASMNYCWEKRSRQVDQSHLVYSGKESGAVGWAECLPCVQTKRGGQCR